MKDPDRAIPAGPALTGETLRKNRIPLYVQLADIFRRRIAEGDWPVKERIPAVDKLVAEFEVARVTIRQALGLLEQEGLIVRYRAKGSFVLKRPTNERWLSLRTSLRSLEDTLRDADTRFIQCHPADRAPALDPEDGAPAPAYQFLRRENSRDGVVYAIVDIHLDRTLFDRHPVEDLERKTITALVFSDAERGPFEGHQTLTIASADAEIAGLLDMPINAPIARVRRIVRDRAGTVVYLANVVYRGEFVRLDIALS